MLLEDRFVFEELIFVDVVTVIEELPPAETLARELDDVLAVVVVNPVVVLEEECSYECCNQRKYGLQFI